jgi:hypothetical protein
MRPLHRYKWGAATFKHSCPTLRKSQLCHAKVPPVYYLGLEQHYTTCPGAEGSSRWQWLVIVRRRRIIIIVAAVRVTDAAPCTAASAFHDLSQYRIVVRLTMTRQLHLRTTDSL